MMAILLHCVLVTLKLTCTHLCSKDSDNKENNVEKEAEGSQILLDNNKCDNEKNTVILPFRAVNEDCS